MLLDHPVYGHCRFRKLRQFSRRIVFLDYGRGDQWCCIAGTFQPRMFEHLENDKKTSSKKIVVVEINHVPNTESDFLPVEHLAFSWHPWSTSSQSSPLPRAIYCPIPVPENRTVPPEYCGKAVPGKRYSSRLAPSRSPHRTFRKKEDNRTARCRRSHPTTKGHISCRTLECPRLQWRLPPPRFVG